MSHRGRGWTGVIQGGSPGRRTRSGCASATGNPVFSVRWADLRGEGAGGRIRLAHHERFADLL
ncbi:hypothetical protein SBD_2375 [Streptomyces bottropensis ATCC 25435]|uniref:Uncharacterized protein n=1 Tax=Streptomyces bottropensis ATCC 25435 TaxID=1054862 RepID=M3DEJ6_9ACTN|nr:hypothetical protein SBD_2375 [Streptomyces bottropensis ATCC 25435]